MPYDIQLENDDLKISNGDLVLDDDLLQRQQLIVSTSKNDWKQHPNVGVGAEEYLEDDDTKALFSEVREQFRMDRMVATLLQNRNGKILINAKDGNS